MSDFTLQQEANWASSGMYHDARGWVEMYCYDPDDNTGTYWFLSGKVTQENNITIVTISNHNPLAKPAIINSFVDYMKYSGGYELFNDDTSITLTTRFRHREELITQVVKLVFSS
jgi:hypothetical protein